jgi:hypothetical protein
MKQALQSIRLSTIFNCIRAIMRERKEKEKHKIQMFVVTNSKTIP